MRRSPADFEVCFKGKTFLTVNKGQLDVQGIDFQTDLVNVSRLIAILSDALNSALTAQAEALQTTGRPDMTAAKAASPRVAARQIGNIYHMQADHPVTRA